MTYELKDILRKLNHVSAEEHHRIHHEICDYIIGQQLPNSMMLDDYLTSIKYYEPSEDTAENNLARMDADFVLRSIWHEFDTDAMYRTPKNSAKVDKIRKFIASVVSTDIQVVPYTIETMSEMPLWVFLTFTNLLAMEMSDNSNMLVRHKVLTELQIRKFVNASDLLQTSVAFAGEEEVRDDRLEAEQALRKIVEILNKKTNAASFKTAIVAMQVLNSINEKLKDL